MAEKQEQAQQVTQEQEASALDQVISVTRERGLEDDRAKDLVGEAVKAALDGTVTWNKSLDKTIDEAVKQLDEKISRQMNAVMHHPKFQQLEGSWRGLAHLVYSSNTGPGMKIRTLQVSKKELHKDLDEAVEFDQSQVFKKIYSSEFDMPGGSPYGALIGDYEFTPHPEDMDVLEGMSTIGAAGYCPFLAAAGPEIMGMQSFTELSNVRDLSKIFEADEYIRWRSFRESEDSRFVTLTMPRTLAREPYGEATRTKGAERFHYEEAPLDKQGRQQAMDHDAYTWMSTAYVLGAKMTEAFDKYGFCTAIRGAQGGGKVEGLPVHPFKTDEGETDVKCPTEVAITDRRENELSKLGFFPLSHYKKTDYAVFFGGQTVQKPKTYDTPQATENAAISARLPYIMAVSRISHYLKILGRDWIGSFMERDECEESLNRWISNFVLSDPKPTQQKKAQYPLAEAKIEVQEVPGEPGHYNAVAWLRPWLQLEELTTSMRLVTRIPQQQS